MQDIGHCEFLKLFFGQLRDFVLSKSLRREKMTFAMKQIVGGLLAMTLAVSAGMAFAKGHDQSSSGDPGQNVHTQTVAGAFGLGAHPGKGVGPR